MRSYRRVACLAALAPALLAYLPALSVAAAPDSDNFSQPSVVRGFWPPGFLDESWAGSTTDATKEIGEPSHAGNAGGKSIWFSYTPEPDASGTVVIDTCDSATFDTLLAVYTGSALGTLTQVASNDDAPGCAGGTGSSVTFTASAGTTYRIALDGKNGASGETKLTFATLATNDSFANAIDVGPNPRGFNSQWGVNTRATKETGEPNHEGNPGGRSLWYRFTPTESSRLSIEICELADAETLLAVYTGTSVGSLTPVPDYGARGCGTADRIVIETTAGTTYWIAVDAKNGDGGDFLLDFNNPPGHDDFANARDLGSNPTTANTNTASASKEPGEPNHAGSAGLQSVWYQFTPTATAEMTIQMCGFFDSLLAVYTGSSLGSITPVVSNDDAVGCGDGTGAAGGSRVKFTAVAGTTYKIALDGKNGQAGFSRLEFAGPAPNDNFANAEDVGQEPGNVTGNSLGATKETGEPSHAGAAGGASVWYRFTPTTSGEIGIDACDTYSFDSVVGVYTGANVASLSEVASNDNGPNCWSDGSELSFSAIAGTTYYIAVDGAGGGRGEISMDFTAPSAPPPPADSTPPDTSITDGPAAGATLTSATAAFSFSSAETGSSFECALDSAAYTPCTSPKELSGLSNGSHTFAVRATDSAGNTDPSPASRTFTVAVPAPTNQTPTEPTAADTTPPETAITEGPGSGVTLAVAEATFEFSSTEAGSAFQCSLDGSGFDPCTSPTTLRALGNAGHTFSVTAVDAAGNTDPTPATRSFAVAVPETPSTPPVQGGGAGTAGADRFSGDPLANTWLGGDGADDASGGDGPDLLCGEGGNDELYGDAGADSLFGDFCPGVVAMRLPRGTGFASAQAAGNDRLNGGTGADKLEGGPGNDTLDGGAGDDAVNGGPGKDTLKAGGGKNTLNGGAGNDKLNAVNRKREKVLCGRGKEDTATVDKRDRVKGCEKVKRRRR